MSNLDSAEKMRQVVTAFIERINAHDVDGIINLMSEDFQYVNSAGDIARGRPFMRQEWRKYFIDYPDYQIHVEHLIGGPDGVGVFGSAEGTFAADDEEYDENHWLVPAAWFGTSRDGKIIHWQTYSDPSIVLDIKSQHEAPSGSDE